MSLSVHELMERAKQAGFTSVGLLDPSKIELRTEVREACAAGKCTAYDHNWTCPPACGTLEECAERIARYKTGFIVQLTGELEDELDYETMMELAQKNKELFKSFVPTVRDEYPDALCLSAGGCTICDQCTYPDAPCRFPEKSFSSMEGYGMVVSDVCRSNDLPYYYGKNTITYVGCYLLY